MLRSEDRGDGREWSCDPPGSEAGSSAPCCRSSPFFWVRSPAMGQRSSQVGQLESQQSALEIGPRQRQDMAVPPPGLLVSARQLVEGDCRTRSHRLAPHPRPTAARERRERTIRCVRPPLNRRSPNQASPSLTWRQSQPPPRNRQPAWPRSDNESRHLTASAQAAVQQPSHGRC